MMEVEEGPRRRTKQRSVHCSPEEQEAIRSAARKGGKTISRLVRDLAHADADRRHRLELSDDDQRELIGGVRKVGKVLGALRTPLPGFEGLNLFDAIAILSKGRRQ